MSYRSPTEPKYVPTSGAVNRMQQNLVSAAEEQLKAKKERENEIKADKTLDRQVAIGYGKTLGESINGSEISGVLNTTYKGYNKEAAALERIMLDGKCATPDCEVETKQLQILKGAPDASLDLLSNLLLFPDFLPDSSNLASSSAAIVFSRSLAAFLFLVASVFSSFISWVFRSLLYCVCSFRFLSSSTRDLLSSVSSGIV